MFLSNPRPFFLLALFCVILFQACGSSAVNVNSPVSLTGETKSEFPFSTKEPEVYQGDFVMGDGKTEEHYFIARKGNKWRVDFEPQNRTWIHLTDDVLYDLDHRRKIFEETPEHQVAILDPSFFNELTYNFFKGKEYREFEEIGREGNLVKYKVKGANVFVTVDSQSGMLIRQEFLDRIGEKDAGSQIDYIYEVRNLSFQVDDSIFELPAGYRKVTHEERYPSTKSKK